MHTDVLLVGYNSGDFDEYVASMRAGGEHQAAYRDVRLAALPIGGHQLTSMDVLNRYGPFGGPEMSNADFLWPVITYLGSYLQRAGFAWDYVNRFREQRDLFERKLRDGDVRCLVITTTVYVSPQPILEIVALARQVSPQTRIIIGGPYLSDKPRTMPPGELPQLLSALGGDVYVFSPEGESTLVRVLDVLCRDRGSLAGVPNIAYHDGADWQLNQTEVENNSLIDHPVDYTLFRGEDIGEFLSIRTAKSCPFNCSFCGFPGRAGKYTYLDVDLVEQELDRIAALGTVSTLTVIDDTFNVPKPRFKEILRMMIRKNYGLRWNSYLRSDHVDDEALDLMRESGCEGVFLGVESGSADQLKNMNKTSRPEHYLHAIRRCRELGIVTYASLIVGFPGETERTLDETRAFLDEARPDFFRAQCWYADPYTPVFKDLDRHRIIGQGFRWSHRTMDSQAASAWVDHFFNTVESSVWLPQNGFELWSVYYLRRHGMSLERIKAYLGAFNDAIRAQVLHGDRAVDPGLLDALTGQARAAKSPLEAPPAPHRYSPGPVRAGIEHWIGEISGPADVGITWPELHEAGPAWQVSPVPLDAWTGAAAADVTAAVAPAVARLRRGTYAALLAGELDPQRPVEVYPVQIADPAGAGAPERVRAALRTGPPIGHTAESAAQHLSDLGRPVRLPDTAVLTVTGTPPAVAPGEAVPAALAALAGRTLAQRVDVAFVGLPGGTWHLAHRGVLGDDDAADLVGYLGAGPVAVGVTPTAAVTASAPTFDL